MILPLSPAESSFLLSFEDDVGKGKKAAAAAAAAAAAGTNARANRLIQEEDFLESFSPTYSYSSAAAFPSPTRTQASPSSRPNSSRGRGSKAKAASNAKKKKKLRDEKGTGSSSSRYWSKEEKKRFEVALKLYKTDHNAIAKHIGSRSATQVRSHARKYYKKLVSNKKTSNFFSAE